MPSSNVQSSKQSTRVLMIVIALLSAVFSCQSPGTRADRSRIGEKNIPALVGTCLTSDTLLELIGQGVSAAKVWNLSDTIASLDPLMRAIENSGLKPKAESVLFDTTALAGLVKTVYRDWGITFNPCDTAIGAFFPHLVFEAKRGACLGIGLLFLMIAEKYGYPLHGVVLPGHFFLRADPGGGEAPRNIEPNAMGIERSDDYYRKRYGISPDSWYYPLRSLSRKETAAVFFYMVGTICRERGRLPEAAQCYSVSLRLFPDYPDALGNLALVLAQEGKQDSALYLLDRAAVVNPGDERIWRNKGFLLLEQGSFKGAFDLAVQRLAVTPEDTVLLYIAALGAIKTARYDEARKSIRRLSARGDAKRARELERLLKQLKR